MENVQSALLHYDISRVLIDLQTYSTHPIAMPHLFYETFWATDKFNDRWEEADGWPFVWSTGYVP